MRSIKLKLGMHIRSHHCLTYIQILVSVGFFLFLLDYKRNYYMLKPKDSKYLKCARSRTFTYIIFWHAKKHVTNRINNLSTGPHKRMQIDTWLLLEMAESSLRVVLCIFKINLENTMWRATVHKQFIGWSKISQIRFFLCGVWSKILWMILRTLFM